MRTPRARTQETPSEIRSSRSVPSRSRLSTAVRGVVPRPTVVFDTYWRFAQERLAIYERRVRGDEGPATTDPILASYRFTNAYRVTDRVSQYLLSEVQYDGTRSREPRELFFRTLLFKIFNRIDTWERLESECGPSTWADVDLERLDRTLEAMRLDGPIYSAAYIMPAPAFGGARKHTNHLRMLARMMEDRLPDRIRQAMGLEDVYALLRSYPGVGRFLAFQYTIDLNYSSLLAHDEDGFVVAGPGALDGISKCFSDIAGWSPERVIYWVVDRQEREFAERGIVFSGLHGRRLQPIDCQNLFCEVSKYARVAHPEVIGCADRTRIKQAYRQATRPLPPPVFPPRWGLMP